MSDICFISSFSDSMLQRMESKQSETSASTAQDSSSSIEFQWIDLNVSDISDKCPPQMHDFVERNVEILELYVHRVIEHRNQTEKQMDLLHETNSYYMYTREAKMELFEYVSVICSKYREVNYHNFEHASHVLSSSDALIRLLKEASCHVTEAEKFEFNIFSCPMAHLALVFGALIHDVDHQGVGNSQLQTENGDLSRKYNGISIAENNSIDMALNILKEDRFSKLRECLFGSSDDTLTKTEHAQLFERLLRDMILATDINSKECRERTIQKWRNAMEIKSDDPPMRISYSEESYLQVSSILEQLIQASDVAHLMQSWPLFLKWGKKLYHEIWAARQVERGPEAPSNWYQVQIDFFDFYVLDLAKRLDCTGVFGQFGKLFFNNAMENRKRWIKEGSKICEDIIAEMSSGA